MECCPRTVPPSGQTIVVGPYGGNSTSSGTESTGDAVAEATFFDDPLTSLAAMVDEWLQLWGLGGE